MSRAVPSSTTGWVDPDATVEMLPAEGAPRMAERLRVLEMAMAFHTGRTTDHNAVIASARAFLAFLHEKSAE